MPRSQSSRLPHPVESILFDAGGVLLDLDYGYLRRLVQSQHGDVREAALSRAEALARREVDRAWRRGTQVDDPWRAYFRLLLGHVGLPAAAQEGILDSLWKTHRRAGLWTAAVAGAVETVARLKASGYRLGVVSNAEGQVARDLDLAGFTGLFETVVDSHRVGVRKPDPGIFKIALERMNCRAAAAVYLGDVPAFDVDGARAASLAPILLDRHDLYPDTDVPRLRSIEELPRLLP